MNTRRFSRPFAFVFICVTLANSAAHAGGFNPTLTIEPGATTTNTPADIRFWVGQVDHDAIPQSYNITIPGWRFDPAILPSGQFPSPNAEPVQSCPQAAAYAGAQANQYSGSGTTSATSATVSSISTKLDTIMKRAGGMMLILQTTQTRDSSSPQYNSPDSNQNLYLPGRIWYDDATKDNVQNTNLAGGTKQGNLWFLKAARPDGAPPNVIEVAQFCGFAFYFPSKGDEDIPCSKAGTACWPEPSNTHNPRVSPDEQVIQFELDMTLVSDGTNRSWDVSWNFFNEPSGCSSSHSCGSACATTPRCTVNKEYRSGAYSDTSWLQDPANAPSILTDYLYFTSQPVSPYSTFSWTPKSAGQYQAVGTFAPCEPTGSDLCASAGPAVTRNVIIAIGSGPSVGFHPFAALASPSPSHTSADAAYTVFTGNKPVPIKWTYPPNTSPFDQIKGFALIVAHPDPLPDDTDNYYTGYFITNPTYPGYDASSDPCAGDVTHQNCGITLQFPLETPSGLLNPDGLYTTSLVTLFVDGHRSDGRCDNGTIVGARAPCSDGSMPAINSAQSGITYYPGVSFGQFLIRPDEFTQGFLEVNNGSTSRLLLVNFVMHRYEFILWRPLQSVAIYSGGGLTVKGKDDLGVGSIVDVRPPSSNIPSPQCVNQPNCNLSLKGMDFSLFAVIAGGSAKGIWEQRSSSQIYLTNPQLFAFNASQIPI